jgi:hypothetical protein
VLLMYNNGLVDLDSLGPDDLNTVAIAQALARINRFSGNLNSISVAQHAMLVSSLIAGMGGGPIMQLSGLHHDDCEVFIGDVPAPVKTRCPELMEIEGKILDVIDYHYGVDTRNEMVKKADSISSFRELEHMITMTPLATMPHLNVPDGAGGFAIAPAMLVPWDYNTTVSRFVALHSKLSDEADDYELDDEHTVKELGPCLN